MEETEKAPGPDLGSEPESDAGSIKSSSSSIEYRSSSAEPISRADSEKGDGTVDKVASKSPSRSPSSEKKLPDFAAEKNNDGKLHFRRKRPYSTNYNRREDGYFRNRYYQRNNNNNNNKDYNKKYAHRREYSSSPCNEKKTNRRFEVDERRKDDGPFESPFNNDRNDIEKTNDTGILENVILKPSDIKNNAKQSAKSFLDMLEEKKLNEAFVKQLIVPQETKKIAVKLHTFVNTFSSLNQNAENGDKEKIMAEETMNSNDRKCGENSPREEGEIISDSEVKQPPEIMKKVKKITNKKSNVEKVKKKKKNETKKSKKDMKKKKRQTSDSSDSDDSSASSSYSSSYSSDSDSDSSETDSSDESSSNSSSSETSSSSSSSTSSYSSPRKRKAKKRRKRKQSGGKKTKKDNKKRKTSATKKSQRNKKLKKKSGKKMVKTESEQSDSSSSSSSSSSSASSGKESQSQIPENPRIEWPKELILHTKTIPSMQFAMNPKHGDEFSNIFGDFDMRKLEKYSGSNNNHAMDDDDGEMLKYESNEYDKHSPQSGENDDQIGKSAQSKGLNAMKKSSGPIKLDMNNDYQYHYQYYHPNGFPHLDPDEQHKASSYCAYYQMFNSNDYTPQQLAGWAAQQGFNLIETNMDDPVFSAKTTNDHNNNGNSLDMVKIKTEDDQVPNQKPAGIKLEEDGGVEEEKNPIPVITTNNISSSISSDFLIFQKMFQQQNGTPDQNFMDQKYLDSPPLSPPPLRPKMTVLEATEPVQLPNGVTLPAGTKQIIVHPYNRPFY